MDSIENIVLNIENELRKELEDQGHVAFGNLLESISSTINYQSDFTQIKFYALEYGKYVNNGLESTDIRYIPLDGNFEEWIKLRFGVTEEKAIKSIYFAIHKVWFKEGRPTDGSYKYSNNGRRKEWITIIQDVLEAKLSKIGEVVANDLLNRTIRKNGSIVS